MAAERGEVTLHSFQEKVYNWLFHARCVHVIIGYRAKDPSCPDTTAATGSKSAAKHSAVTDPASWSRFGDWSWGLGVCGLGLGFGVWGLGFEV